MADDGPVLLPAPCVSRGVQSSWKRSLHERAVLVVGEVLVDGVEGVLEEVGVASRSPVARYRLIRYAGAWSPTEFQFFRARFGPSDSDCAGRA